MVARPTPNGSRKVPGSPSSITRIDLLAADSEGVDVVISTVKATPDGIEGQSPLIYSEQALGSDQTLV